MPVKNRYLFVSYARDDLERVRPLVDAVREELALRSLPVGVWMDIANLKPGEQWNAAISEALNAAVGFLFFLSPRSLSSDWVRREVEIAATASDRLIIPVILHEPLDVPPTLASRQWLRFVGRPSPGDTAKAAAEIAEATERYLRATPRPRPAVSKAEAPIIAADIASDVRSSVEGQLPEDSPKAVFVVHGHDLRPLTQLEEFLHSVSIEPIVLSRQDESPQSLFQKFMTIGGRARFAIVLLGLDLLEKDEVKIKRPSMWNIVFFNDDYTPMDFVQFVLMKIFHRSTEDALALTLAVHTQGKGIAGTYTFEVAEQKQCEVLLMAKIEENPLRVEVEQV
jgi:ATP-dependent Clp protease adaptor protein ClpS